MISENMRSSLVTFTFLKWEEVCRFVVQNACILHVSQECGYENGKNWNYIDILKWSLHLCSISKLHFCAVCGSEFLCTSLKCWSGKENFNEMRSFSFIKMTQISLSPKKSRGVTHIYKLYGMCCPNGLFFQEILRHGSTFQRKNP